jgi:hypothetical protein
VVSVADVVSVALVVVVAVALVVAVAVAVAATVDDTELAIGHLEGHRLLHVHASTSGRCEGGVGCHSMGVEVGVEVHEFRVHAPHRS